VIIGSLEPDMKRGVIMKKKTKQQKTEQLYKKEINGYEKAMDSYDEMIIKLVRAWVVRNWGKRCPDYEKDGPLCKAWECFDYLFTQFEEDE